MNERRPKHTLRRSRRLSQILSSKSPSKKSITPQNLNKREHLKTKRKSNNHQKNSDESDSLLGNGITKQLMLIIPNMTPKSVLSFNSERRLSLKSRAQFCSELGRSRKDENVSKRTMNVARAAKKKGSKKESVKRSKRDDTLTLSEGKTNCTLRRSPRLSQLFSAKTPLKKSATPKKLNQRKQLKAKRQPNRRGKKPVDFDALLGYGICPPGLKPQKQLTNKSRKRKISLDCNESISRRRSSLRPCKRHCLELETPIKDKVSKIVQSPVIPKKKRGSKKKLKPFSVSMSSNKVDSIPLDALLFVSSSRKKKSRDITESSGICSAHSSFVSSSNITHHKSKPDALNLTSSTNVNSMDGSFKIPQTKKKPGKKTLKHKRLVLNELNRSNAGHEDDLLENMRLTPFKNIFNLDSESEASWNIATPKCGFKLSPFLPKGTPVFRDCFSPTELRISRKNAEEFMHRNKKKNQLCLTPQQLPKSKTPADKSVALAILTRLSQEKNIERSLNDEFSSDEEKEDGYNSEEEELTLNNSVMI